MRGVPCSLLAWENWVDVVTREFTFSLAIRLSRLYETKVVSFHDVESFLIEKMNLH